MRSFTSNGRYLLKQPPQQPQVSNKLKEFGLGQSFEEWF